jgi:uncharacterized protein involved in outer membrane biogenesis
MRRKKIISRLTTLVLAMLACLLFAVIAPMFFAQRATEEPFAANSVMALPRDLYVVAAPIRLSSAPDLTIARGVLYADGNAALGMPISKFVLDGPVFYLNVSGLRATASSFESNATGADIGAIAPLVEQLAAGAFDTLNIQRGTVHVTSVDGASETISDLRAEMTGRRKGVIATRGSFTVRGQSVAFDATILSVPDKRTPLRWPMKISLKTGLLEAGFDGHADVAEGVSLSGQTELTTPSLRRVARWFGVPVPIAAGLNAATLKGRFAWAQRTLAMEEAKITVDGNEATGTVSLEFAGERPLIEGTMAFSALDLTQYFEAARSQSLIFDRLTSSWSPFDLSFPLIKYIDADLRISAPAIALKGYTFGRGAASITVRSGKLLASIVELDLPSGNVSAQVTADANALLPHYTLRGKIENFDPGPVGTALVGSTVFSGRSVLTLDLAAIGQTPAEVLRRLSGKAALTMPEGGRAALDLKALRTVSKDNVSPGWGQLTKAQTSIDHLEARAFIVDGVLFPDVMQARAGAVALAATGSIDLAESILDLRLSVRPNAPGDRPHGTSTDTAGADVISVRGPWGSPTVRAEEADANANAN